MTEDTSLHITINYNVINMNIGTIRTLFLQFSSSDILVTKSNFLKIQMYFRCIWLVVQCIRVMFRNH